MVEFAPLGGAWVHGGSDHAGSIWSGGTADCAGGKPLVRVLDPARRRSPGGDPPCPFLLSRGVPSPLWEIERTWTELSPAGGVLVAIGEQGRGLIALALAVEYQVPVVIGEGEAWLNGRGIATGRDKLAVGRFAGSGLSLPIFDRVWVQSRSKAPIQAKYRL